MRVLFLGGGKREYQRQVGKIKQRSTASLFVGGFVGGGRSTAIFLQKKIRSTASWVRGRVRGSGKINSKFGRWNFAETQRETQRGKGLEV